ncbi:MFS general substrate transporter [Calocera viscosa TUFC12733]|uniref:MFS general substrate transporter n=1 Tax=Calocera viscosa (strain TUFC12733) TaxID=1330018 RepID=A0A167I060_CALVF|nr:MFS general substrate transporter [Calocera viscosa TUFC12733]
MAPQKRASSGTSSVTARPVPSSRSSTSGSSSPLLPQSARTPLPKLQLFLICLVRLAEPVASSQIFPYINDLCVEFGYAGNEKEVGFVSGMIEACALPPLLPCSTFPADAVMFWFRIGIHGQPVFALVQLLTVALWGRLSDRIGRKPVVLLGLAGVTLSTLLFGLSRRLWLTILARCLAGGLSGNSAVIQTMISELTDESNESQAFPLYSLMWTLGSVVGPSIGGTLSRPFEQFPGAFTAPFWREHPYFLPCLASAGITGLSMFTSLFLRETLPSKPCPGPQATYGTLSARAEEGAEEVAADSEPPPTAWQILRSPGLPTVLPTAFLMMLTTQAWDVVFPLFAYTSVRAGGLSLSDAQLGACLACAGCVGAAVHLFLFPAMERRFGIRMYPYLLACPMGMYAIAPALNTLLRRLGGEQWERGQVSGWTFVGAGLLLLLGRVAAMVYPCVLSTPLFSLPSA